MFYYVLPGAGIYGGVKKAFHCAELLTSSGTRCIVATPDAQKPTWFSTTAEVMSRNELSRICEAGDTILFSFPPDARFVDTLRAKRKIVHMQGANTRADRALFKRSYEFISHGLHMSYELQRHGRIAPYVPIGVPDIFRWRGEQKTRGSVVVMSRKGKKFIDAVSASLPPGSSFTILDGNSEEEVATILKRADIFVAVSVKEAFGLPPLEAMCAGCCVVGFPGDGGFEFLRHGETAHLAPNGDVAALKIAVQYVLKNADYRKELREGAMQFSGYYTMEREGEYLLRALDLCRLKPADHNAG